MSGLVFGLRYRKVLQPAVSSEYDIPMDKDQTRTTTGNLKHLPG